MNGHCAAVAYVLQKTLGGELVRGVVRVKVNGQTRDEVHYWNRIGGVEIDLTGSQYGGDGLHALDDPQGRVTNRVAEEIAMEFVEVRSKEIRQTVTHSPRFDALQSLFERKFPLGR